MKKIFPALLLLTIFFSAADAQPVHQTGDKTETGKGSTVKFGIASFYAKKFNGRRTATGDIYNSSKYTAACNVLPFHTWIKVTNLINNRSVIVVVNDRLNAKNKRLVDLSGDAAKKLAYTGRGIVRVMVEVLPDYELSAL